MSLLFGSQPNTNEATENEGLKISFCFRNNSLEDTAIVAISIRLNNCIVLSAMEQNDLLNRENKG